MKNKNLNNDDSFEFFSDLDDVDASDLDLEFDDSLDDLNDDFTFGNIEQPKTENKKGFHFFKRKKKPLSKFDIIATEDDNEVKLDGEVEAIEDELSNQVDSTSDNHPTNNPSNTSTIDDDYQDLENLDSFNDDNSFDEDEHQENIQNKLNHTNSKSNFFDKQQVLRFLPKLAVVIILFFVIYGLISHFGNPFDSIISKFATNDKETQTISERLDDIEFNEETNIVPLEDASTALFENYEDGIIACKSNYLAYFKKQGNVVWEINTLIVDPILSVNGQYILIAEKSGTWLYLYKGEKLLYSTEASNPIIDASISSEGDCVLVTDKPFYKGAIEAYNSAGVCIYSHSFGKDYVVCANISPRSRNIAVALMNTTECVSSHVELFSISQTNSHCDINFNNALLCGMEFNSKGLTCYTDTGIYGFNTSGDPIWKHEYSDNLQFQSYNNDIYGNKISLISKSDKPELHIYNKYGTEKKSYLLDDFPDNININNGLFIYSSNRTIVFGKYSFPHQSAASMDVKGVYVIDSNNCMVVYSNSIEFIKS